jgi:hypothetical protein
MTTRRTSNRTSSPGPTTPATPPSEGAAPRAAPDNGETKRPDVVFSLWSDRTTKIDVAVWSNEVLVDGKAQNRCTCAISRTYRKETDGQPEWVKSGSFRTHDVPVLCFLLERAHAWMLAQRLDTDVPF